MTSADVLGLLAETTVSLSVAIGVVFLVRRPLRRWFGAVAGYAAWSVVPVAIVAVLLPSRSVPMMAAVAPDALLRVGAGVAASASMPGSVEPWLVAAWICGAIAMAVRLGFQQSLFVRSLGELHPRPDGTLQADVVAGLPAVVGLLRPRTVVPVDFEARYTGEQRRLLRTHEREHVARGDHWANAFVALLQCLSWFNPLVHLASRAFRHDQELACDQRVLAAYPGARRAYGEAMFNTQLAAQPLPLGCHWGFGHPLKERIAMLKHPLPSRRRWIAGSVLVAALTSFAGLAAWAAQPPSPGAGAQEAGPVADRATRALNPPKYPAAALSQGVSGKLVLLVDIDAEGNPTAVEVESAEPAGVFDQATMDAVWHWKFSPAIEDGKPVASQVRVPVHFEADGTPPEKEGNGAGAMGWVTPDLSDDSNRVSDMNCDAARGDADGDEIACGNLLTDR